MKRAQVTIEFTVALVLMMIFLYGTAKIFVWGAHAFTKRHAYYENTRIDVAPRYGADYFKKDVVWNNDDSRVKLKIFPQDSDE